MVKQIDRAIQVEVGVGPALRVNKNARRRTVADVFNVHDPVVVDIAVTLVRGFVVVEILPVTFVRELIRSRVRADACDARIAVEVHVGETRVAARAGCVDRRGILGKMIIPPHPFRVHGIPVPKADEKRVSSHGAGNRLG